MILLLSLWHTISGVKYLLTRLVHCCFFPGLVSWRIIPTSVDRNTRKAIHLGVQAAAYALAIVGVRAVFKFHNEHVPAIANMYSLHSWLGIVVMILWGLQV